MIRFIDLTEAYWTDPEEKTPSCAFLDTRTDKFIACPLIDAHTFDSLEDVRGIEPKHAVNAPCAPDCIDAEIERDREDRRDRELEEAPDSLGLIDDGSEF